jgi:hypothetical protein
MRWDVPGTGWRNAEYRSFYFADLGTSHTSAPPNGAHTDSHINSHIDDYENATLRETPESRDRRGKIEPQHGREKQAELFNAALQGWENQGLQNPNKVGKEEEVEENEEQHGLVTVLTKDSENTDTRSGEAPATDRSGEAVVDAAVKERERRKSVSIAA